MAGTYVPSTSCARMTIGEALERYVRGRFSVTKSAYTQRDEKGERAHPDSAFELLRLCHTDNRPGRTLPG